LVRCAFWIRKNPANGCQNGSKSDPSKPGIQHPTSIGNVIEVYRWGYGGKRSSDRIVARAHMRYLCQNRPKIEAQQPPRPQGSSFHPKFYQQPIYTMLLHYLHQKRSMPGPLKKRPAEECSPI